MKTKDFFVVQVLNYFALFITIFYGAYQVDFFADSERFLGNIEMVVYSIVYEQPWQKSLIPFYFVTFRTFVLIIKTNNFQELCFAYASNTEFQMFVIASPGLDYVRMHSRIGNESKRDGNGRNGRLVQVKLPNQKTANWLFR